MKATNHWCGECSTWTDHTSLRHEIGPRLRLEADGDVARAAAALSPMIGHVTSSRTKSDPPCTIFDPAIKVCNCGRDALFAAVARRRALGEE